MKEKEKTRQKPDLLFRFKEVKIISLSLSGKRSSTVTLEYLDERGKKRTRWCFFNEEKFGEVLNKAIRSDWTLDVLVERYCFGEFVKEILGEDNHIVDWLEDVWRVKKG